MESNVCRVYEHIGYLNNWPLKGHLLRLEDHKGKLLYHSLWGIKKICLMKEVQRIFCQRKEKVNTMSYSTAGL